MKPLRLAILLMCLLLPASAALASSGPPTNSSPADPRPEWDGSFWIFKAQNDTDCAAGPAEPCEKICLEIAKDDNGSLSENTKLNTLDSEDPDANGLQTEYTFTVQPPTWAKGLSGNQKVTYKFYVVDESSDCAGTPIQSTGFDWSFNTTANAIALRSAEARPAPTGWPLIVAGLGAAALAGIALLRRK